MRQLKFTLLLAMLFSVVATPAWAYDAQVDGIYYNFNTTDGTATVTYLRTGSYYYSGWHNYNAEAYTGDVVIPKTVTYNETTYQVVAISESAFEYCAGLTSVTIPEGITSIGNNAFYYCRGLITVTIPEGVTIIGSSAFKMCSGLATITIPKTVTEIGSDAFSSCSGLSKVIISDISAWCNISFGDGLSNPLSYAEHLYSDADTEITDLVVPAGVETIKANAFYSCEGLASVVIPASVTAINSGAFSGCTNLTKVTISNLAAWCNISFGSSSANPLYYAKHLYSDAGTEITDLVVPVGVETINAYTFYNCEGLTSVVIPASVTAINAGVFSGCTNLTKVTLNSNTIASESSFGTKFGTQVKEYVLGEGVTTIGGNAFSNCTNLEQITFPASLKEVGRNAFYGRTNLKKVIAKDWASWFGITFVDAVANPLYYAKHLYSDENTEITDLVVPAEVETINANAFYNCEGLKSVTIPNNVTAIGDDAFYGCNAIESITIPANVSSIGNSSFYNCTKLAKVTINSSSIISKSYTSSSSLKNIFGTKVKEYILGNDITSIGNYVFYGCNAESVTVGDNIVSVGTSALSGAGRTYVKKGTKSLLALWIAGQTPYEIGSSSTTFYGLTRPSFEKVSSTQTTVSWRFTGTYCPEYTYTLNDEPYNRSVVTLTGFRPDQYVSIRGLKVTLGDLSYSPASVSTYTSSISPRVTAGETTASSLTAKGTYTKGDAVVSAMSIKLNTETKEGNEIYLNGLNPGSSYSATYTITVQYGDNNQYTYNYTGSATIKTDALTLTTQQPKVVTVGNVIVSAQSNIDDAEENVGFEWRRTDWTDDFTSNKGAAYMYEGTMEGYIRNLYTEKLWKYRPYYLASSGTYYYGDWVGIDPTNTSYFEPTVHTYAQIVVEGNGALVKGYTLPGSDNITVQGFKYWKTASGTRSLDDVTLTAVNVPDDAMSVTATGRLMEANLTGLDYETTYNYVAFVTTSEGETFYGELQSFTTGTDTTPIGGIRVDESADGGVHEVARYNMRGQRISVPEPGINIVRMSDGTTKKVVVK